MRHLRYSIAPEYYKSGDAFVPVRCCTGGACYLALRSQLLDEKLYEVVMYTNRGRPLWGRMKRKDAISAADMFEPGWQTKQPMLNLQKDVA